MTTGTLYASISIHYKTTDRDSMDRLLREQTDYANMLETFAAWRSKHTTTMPQ